MSVVPSDEIAVDRPIMVIGAPRSGTTILSRVLEAHPDVVRIGEPRLTWRYGNESRSDVLRPEHLTPEIRRFIRRSFADEAAQAGKPRFVEKSPQNSLRVDFLRAVFPEARFVHIIRDGRESTASIRDHWQRFSGGLKRKQFRQRARELDWRRAPYYVRELLRRALPESFAPVVGRRLWGPRIPGLEQMLKELDLIEICALQWRMCVETACIQGRKLPPDRYMECRLEDFSPELIRTVLEFCELPDDGSIWKEYEGRFDPGRKGSRAHELGPEELARVLEWIEPTLGWLGYPVDGASLEGGSLGGAPTGGAR